jgi:beta-galactosidase/beta-glucuronidase
LHRLTVKLSGDQAADQRELTYGLRDLGVSPVRDFTVNGRPILLRGTLECAIFPETGFPPTDEAAWERIYKICREHGLNHVRFHSWTPPRAAFAVADRMGFYLQIEMGAWTGVGKGHPQDDWLYREAARVLREYGNHPSFVLMAYGNEPLPYSADADRDRWLSKWVDHWKAYDSRRLQTSAGFYPQLPENQFHITLADRGPSRWPDKLLRTDPRVPILVHEMGQYCVYPDFREIERYTGHLKARNFEIFRDTARANGVLPLASQFLEAS